MLHEKTQTKATLTTHGRDAILIAGPTASGKSAVALKIAQVTNGVIVNADSMQVYRDLRVLTARPDEGEEAAATHRLYGHIDGADEYSVGHWLANVTNVLADVKNAGFMPIFVGGTGLYFKALLEGISPIPAISADIRHAIRARSAAEGPQRLHDDLSRVDPVLAARIKPGDSQRIIRALEVEAQTGRPLSDWQKEVGMGFFDPARTVRVFLNPDRAALYDRINARFDEMLGMGALDEVVRLKARGLAPDQPLMRAHGVPHFVRYLDGDVDLETALNRAKADVRHYAKRQTTWFRGQMAGWTATTPDDAVAAINGLL